MNYSKESIGDFCGWYGTVAILAAYGLVSFSVISADGVLYQTLNLSGAVGMIVLGLTKKIYQTAVLNVIWAGIAALAIGKIWF